MPNGETERIPVGLIHDRIGPIFDPAFLKLLPKEVMKEIALARATAVRDTMKAELGAMEAVLKAIDKVRF